jgi:hypothetical protein
MRQPDRLQSPRGREFRAAIPLLMSGARENADDESTTSIAARSERLRKTTRPISHCSTACRPRMDDVAAETFAWNLDAGQSVQQALAASSARMLARTRRWPTSCERPGPDEQVNAQLGITQQHAGTARQASATTTP